MKLEWLIAVRYLFARGKKTVVTFISWVSLTGLTVSTAALIVVLSVYNGIGDITKSLFGTFDPPILVEPQAGKTLPLTDDTHAALLKIDGVERVAPIVDENAWITYNERQAIATLRGVDSSYAPLSGIDTMMANGHYMLHVDGLPTLVVGGELFYNLGIHLLSNTPATVMIPRRGTSQTGFTLDDAFNVGHAYPIGLFFIQQDIDGRFMIADISFVRQLMNYADNECTSLAVGLAPEANVGQVKQAVSRVMAQQGIEVNVRDRQEQQPLYYKILRTEHLGIYLVLSLIVLISTLSLVASLSLLVINKRSDVFILKSMGLPTRRIRRAFLCEGLLICGMAVVAGLTIGLLLCVAQQQLGLIRMGDGNFIVEAFPVAMRLTDFIYSFILVMLISGLSVWLTVHRANID